MISEAGGFLGFVLDATDTLQVPVWVWLSLMLGGLSLAQFKEFYKVRQQRELLNAQVNDKKGKNGSGLRDAKRLLRENADDGRNLTEPLCSKPEFEAWFDAARATVEELLGRPQANTFRRLVEGQNTQLYRLNGGAGWLDARAEQIIEADLNPHDARQALTTLSKPIQYDPTLSPIRRIMVDVHNVSCHKVPASTLIPPNSRP